MDNPSARFPAWIVLCLQVSAIASLAGIILLIIFYSIYLSTGETNIFGPLNDTAVVIQYLLMLPLVFAFHHRLRLNNLKLSAISLLIGLLGIVGVIILQSMLILGFIPFSKQVGIVSIFFLITLVWFLVNRNLDVRNELFPESLVLTIFAGLVFGYPIWAWKVAAKHS